MKRKIYLDMHSRKDAQQRFLSRFHDYLTTTETISVYSCGGRITASPIFARLSAPSFHSAAMDGIAVRAEDTYTAADDNPVTLDIAGGQADLINTGFPLPEDKNCVIMIENTVLSEDDSSAVIRAPAFPWQHVRKVGEDIVATEQLFPTGHRIAPPDMAALLTAGCREIEVRKKPKITIVPTGTELIGINDFDDVPPPGRTIESNSAALAGIAEGACALPEVTPIMVDDYESLKSHIEQLASGDSDMIVINAGSSAGSADYTAAIIDELGEILVHGVTIMPGKPTILGCINDKPVIGIPGYPVSAIIAFEQFAVPLLEKMQGVISEKPRRLPGILAKDLPSRSGIEEFRRMIAGKIGDELVALPLKKGSGAITTLTRANTMLHIAASSEGLTRGSRIELEPLQPEPILEKTLLCTGSHDMSLELLRDLLQKRNPPYHLASTHVGSLGGIMALKESMTHVAGSHLLDPASGTYNTTFVNKYLGDRDIAVITVAHRRQGLITAQGNPKDITSISDLVRDDITFINRQAGSGTRVLCDYMLDEKDLDSDDINGYEHDEYTHMAVAVSVLSGKADAGLGIMSAAKALNLGFIPVIEERYDLLLEADMLDHPMISALLETLGSTAFKQSLEAMGGYSTRETGNRVA